MMVSLQDMIENVLEIKDTHVREVMTPLIDVVAIDGSATLVDFHNLWVTHQYSRYIKFWAKSLMAFPHKLWFEYMHTLTCSFICHGLCRTQM